MLEFCIVPWVIVTQIDRQTDRQKDRQTDRQIDGGQTDRHTHTYLRWFSSGSAADTSPTRECCLRPNPNFYMYKFAITYMYMHVIKGVSLSRESTLADIPETAWPSRKGQRSRGRSPCNREGWSPAAHTVPVATGLATPPLQTDPVKQLRWHRIVCTCTNTMMYITA